MRWSTAGAAEAIKQVGVPTFGLVGFLGETRQDEPRILIVSACLVMMGLPAAALLDRLPSRNGRGDSKHPPDQPGSSGGS